MIKDGCDLLTKQDIQVWVLAFAWCYFWGVVCAIGVALSSKCSIWKKLLIVVSGPIGLFSNWIWR